MSSDSLSDERAKRILTEHIDKTYETHAFQEDWRNLPEIPTAREINPPPKGEGREKEEWNSYQREPVYDPELPINIIDGPWPSKDAYIGTHYKLLREDAIAGLRKAVLEVKKNPATDDTEHAHLYTQVTIRGILLAQRGPAIRVEFSCERAQKQIRWTSSKRLMQGTIVALTPKNDMFHKICKVAVVAARPISGGLDQDPPSIDLFMLDEDIFIDPVEQYMMVEGRNGYFEASRYMLVGMQKLMTESFPLKEHLVDLDQHIQTPKYLESQPCLDLTSLEHQHDDLGSGNPQLFNVNVLTGFPSSIDSSMDSSQMKACRNMLTKKVAIVQGPPGTGKTFVSVAALRLLIENSPSDAKIIVTAQTNHALDQLLNHIMKFEPNIVRLGGRSDKANVAIQKRTLYEIRAANPRVPGIAAGLGGCRREHSRCCEAIKKCLEHIVSSEPLKADVLLQHGIITAGQRDSLCESGWAEAEIKEGEAPLDDLQTWLGPNELQEIRGADPVNYGLPVEDEDIEFEQLQELEREMAEITGLTEEKDLEALRGVWIPFNRKYTGRGESTVTFAKWKKLAASKNLFSIPENNRGAVYRCWEVRLNRSMLAELRAQLIAYRKYMAWSTITRSMCSIKLINNLGIKVIGCTTTGLTKYRGLLSALQPRTLLIEEAAETLEGKIIGGLFESIEQMILVGDHKQLQASCNVRALEFGPYHLNVSMFERLVQNNIGYVMLNTQRRMIREIRNLLCVEPHPFYRDLNDHKDVLDRVHNRPPVPGMGGIDTYFFHHRWPESRNADFSVYNQDEADMIAGFYHHLYLNGVKPSKITILTFYNGQRKTILRTLKRLPLLRGIVYFNVVTVDSYQGEENDVIIVSLVRSNLSLGIGFLDNRNRLVVALSRARRGLYLFGNAVTLTGLEESKDTTGREALWLPLIKHMAENRRFNMDLGLPTTCSKHNRVFYQEDRDSWFKFSGGCDLNCAEGDLPCGHPCTLRCHPFDHIKVNCSMPCERTPPCGNDTHSCANVCGDHCECALCGSRSGQAVEIPDIFPERGCDFPRTSKRSMERSTSQQFGSLHSNTYDESPHSKNQRRARQVNFSEPGPSSKYRSASRTARRSRHDQGDFSQPTAPSGYGSSLSAKANSAAVSNWKHFAENAKDSDRAANAEILAKRAAAPKVEMNIEEMFKKTTAENGVRTVVGTTHSIIPQSGSMPETSSTTKNGATVSDNNFSEFHGSDMVSRLLSHQPENMNRQPHPEYGYEQGHKPATYQVAPGTDQTLANFAGQARQSESRSLSEFPPNVDPGAHHRAPLSSLRPLIPLDDLLSTSVADLPDAAVLPDTTTSSAASLEGRMNELLIFDDDPAPSEGNNVLPLTETPSGFVDTDDLISF